MKDPAHGGIFCYVRRAWHITRRWKSVIKVYSYLLLAKGKGVHREVESEGNRRQSSGPRNTNIIKGIVDRMSLHIKVKSKSYTEIEV
jgi:hypothetical protein